MDSHQPRKTSTAFEYFLYASMVVETGLAAIIYKIVFRNPDLAHLRYYFAIFYFAFLAWAITQLNTLHRDRNQRVANATPAELPAEEQQNESHSAETGDTRPVLGLTGIQLVIVVVVFATAVATFSLALRLLP